MRNSRLGTSRGLGSRRGAFLFLILLAGLIASGGMVSTCNPCTPQTPGYDAATGLCTTSPGGALEPARPGTGNLPVEPGTPEPTTQPSPDLDPNSVDLIIYGLNGQWLDNGRKVCVNHHGSGVNATYYVAYDCDHQDSTMQHSETTNDFDGTLSGKTLTGTTTVCSYGHDDTSQNGLMQAQMTLTVSNDGKSLSGSWVNTENGSNVPLSLSRQTVGDCHAN